MEVGTATPDCGTLYLLFLLFSSNPGTPRSVSFLLETWWIVKPENVLSSFRGRINSVTIKVETVGLVIGLCHDENIDYSQKTHSSLRST